VPLPVPMLGHVTSSYYSAFLERSIAMALVKNGRNRMGEKVELPLRRRPRVARHHREPGVRRSRRSAPAWLSTSTCAADPSDEGFLAAVRVRAGVRFAAGCEHASSRRGNVPTGSGPMNGCWRRTISATLARALTDALAGMFAAVTEVGGGNEVLVLEAATARESLAAECPLDLDPRTFGPGQCAQTRFRARRGPAAAARQWRHRARRAAQLRRSCPATPFAFSRTGGTMNTRRGCISVLGAASLALALPVLAEYPDKPMKLIVPWPPGGVTDTLARFTADQLGRSISQAVVVENKAGANGIIGTQSAMALAPDGYGLLAVTAETHAINPRSTSRCRTTRSRTSSRWRWWRASRSCSRRARTCRPTACRSWWRTRRPTRARSRPRATASAAPRTWASRPSRSSPAPATRMSPFQGVAPAVNALLGGQVDIAFVNAFNVEPHRKTGKVKILGVAGPKRLHTIADVPTMAEQGIEGLHAGNWYWLRHAARRARRGAQKLAAELQKVGNSTAFQEKTHSMGVEAEFRDPAQFADFLKAEGSRLGEVVRDKGIELQR
jgi:tripartite-type tricarboxylate transporter receptor subunit TctC/sarcosine oxidase gamma subunit